MDDPGSEKRAAVCSEGWVGRKACGFCRQQPTRTAPSTAGVCPGERCWSYDLGLRVQSAGQKPELGPDWALPGASAGPSTERPVSGQAQSSNRRHKAMQGHFSLHLAFERDLTPFHRVNPWTKAESGFFKWILKCSINWEREVRS